MVANPTRSRSLYLLHNRMAWSMPKRWALLQSLRKTTTSCLVFLDSVSNAAAQGKHSHLRHSLVVKVALSLLDREAECWKESVSFKKIIEFRTSAVCDVLENPVVILSWSSVVHRGCRDVSPWAGMKGEVHSNRCCVRQPWGLCIDAGLWGHDNVNIVTSVCS